MEKIYFLGPKGTYSEIAAKTILQKLNLNLDLIPISTIPKIIEQVNINSNSLGVVPIENSIEGIVRPTIDTLYKTDVKIQTQIDIKIRHCLISKANSKEKIKHIISHPQALAQSQKYILENFDENIDLMSANSTASAITSLIEKDETFSAIGSRILAQSLNFNILDENIGDIKENKTRFVLISKNKIEISKNTRTSLVFNTKNESGALLEILNIFKKYNLNLVYLESRPSKKVFGEYNFFVDVDKGFEDFKEAISEIKEKCNFYKLLGSYPVISN